ncbi:barstar family protein [Dyella tabacisoli]|uniref:Barnase inhibitor n=1 Tax=Dyella tabacisoli TaxID=2282381 RepID=A0A369UUG8_9GAMM|nr:barstar family protein [Dyella tabacisoli]RDD83368.1 barnase inhibitor [Dyella tabacisoli]
MSTNDLHIDLGDPARGGVFFVTAEDLDALAAAASKHWLHISRIQLQGCRDKTELLKRLAKELPLPADFGHNWDALADCMRDLAWLNAPGYLLLFEHAEDLRDASEDDFDTLLDILDEAAESWLDAKQPYFVFFALPESAFEDNENG